MQLGAIELLLGARPDLALALDRLTSSAQRPQGKGTFTHPVRKAGSAKWISQGPADEICPLTLEIS